MQGIDARHKRYVPVTTFTNEEGQVRRMSSRRVGGDGICYTIRVGRNVTRLYFEDPKWFVEAKEPWNDCAASDC